MIFKIIGIPIQPLLPFDQRFHQLLGAQASLEPLQAQIIAAHVLKGEHHIQLSPALVTQILCHIHSDKYGFAHRKSTVRLQHIPAQLLENLVAAGGGQIMLLSRQRQLLLAIR